jgi:D-proline reductase (dithiol) PrdB
MVRLSDLPDRIGGFLANLPVPEFESTPWEQPPALAKARVALISTAGLHRSADRKFQGITNEYRIIPGEGEIASVAQWHYSFMGATPGELFAETGVQVARLLKDDGVTAAVLVPI